METNELLKKVRKIEIKTRGLSNQIFSGEYHSAFKGRGMAFSEVREYAYGDPIRTIDWNVTARFNHPYVKVFEEEREMTVMLVIDMSASSEFGSVKQFKKDLMAEMMAVLAFSASQNNDKIGAILFTDQVEKFIPPKKGRSHILRIIREVLQYKPQSTKTNIQAPLVFLTNALKKRCTAFLMSDFVDDGFSDAIRIANKKHDLVSLWVQDPLEEELPNVGFLQVKDNETGQIVLIDSSDAHVRDEYKKNHLARKHKIQDIFRRSGVDFAEISTRDSYIKPLMNLFKKREYHR